MSRNIPCTYSGITRASAFSNPAPVAGHVVTSIRSGAIRKMPPLSPGQHRKIAFIEGNLAEARQLAAGIGARTPAVIPTRDSAR